MRNKPVLLFPVLFAAILLSQCAKKGTAVIEPKFGIYNFSTYTIDSLRFRIVLNGIVLTDSLLSPVGFYSKAISFYSSGGRLQIIDAKNNNQLIFDSTIQMRTGFNNFSLVQLLNGQKPYIPAPPNEISPAPGKYKVRFQYTPFIGDAGFPAQPFFYDSVRCYIRKNGVDIDTQVLRKFGLTPFYEAQSGGSATFSIMLEDPATGNVIDDNTSPTIGGSFTGFNTISVSGRAPVDEWRLIRMY